MTDNDHNRVEIFTNYMPKTKENIAKNMKFLGNDCIFGKQGMSSYNDSRWGINNINDHNTKHKFGI